MENKNNNMLRYFLREYYDDGGGDYGYGGGYHHGVSDAFFSDIWNAFVDPLKTTTAFTEKFSSKIQKIAGKLSERIMSIIIPGYTADFERFDQEEQERLNLIHDKYKNIYGRTDWHLFTGDAALMAFLYAPHQYLTARVVRQAPDAALAMLDSLAGGNPTILGFTKRARDFTKRFKHYGRMRGGPTSPNPIPVENTTRNNNIINEGLLDKIKDFFSKKEVANAIENSPVAQSMQKDAEQYVKNWTNNFVNMTKQSMADKEIINKAAESDQDLSNEIRSMGQEEKQKVSKLATVGSKKAIKKIASEKINEKINQLPGGKSHPLAKFYAEGISAINKL